MIKNKFKIIFALSVSLLIALVAFMGVIITKASSQDPLDVKLEGVKSQAYLGEKVEIALAYPKFPESVDKINNFVLSPSGKTVELDEGVFSIEEEGDYGIYYGVVGTDGSSKTTSYTLKASKAEFPVLTSKPLIPIAVFNGETTNVPQATFTDYTVSAPSSVAYEVFYVGDDGVETKVENTFVPSVALNGSSISLIYRATSSLDKKNEIVYEIPVLNAKGVDASGLSTYSYGDMFLKENVDRHEVTKNGVVFYGSSDISLTFANYVNANFKLDLKSLEGYANFDKVRITATDSISQSQINQIEIMAVNDKNSSVIVNGGTSISASGSLKDFTNGLSLSFDNSNATLSDGAGNDLIQIAKALNGRDFIKYKSQKISLKIELLGVKASSALCISGINKHIFTTHKTLVNGQLVEGASPDFIAPDIVIEKDIQTTINIGEELVIPSALGIDVIDNNPSVTVGLSQNGTPVNANDGTNLFNADASKEYIFTPSELGEYNLVYTVKDAAGNTFLYNQSIRVKDSIAPTIDVTGELNRTVKVGEEMKIPTFSCSDNLTEQENLKSFVAIHLPYHTYIVVKADDTFKFEKTGIYYIRYTVYDEFYNMTTAEIKVVCE